MTTSTTNSVSEIVNPITLASNAQLKYLRDLQKKYYITVEMPNDMSKRLASKKISNILAAVESGKVRLRDKKTQDLINDAKFCTDNLLAKAGDVHEEMTALESIMYDAQEDFNRQPGDFYETIDNELEEKGLGIPQPEDFKCSSDYYRAIGNFVDEDGVSNFTNELIEGLKVPQPEDIKNKSDELINGLLKTLGIE